MNALDYGVIVLALLSVGAGVVRGAIREVINLAGWILAYGSAHAFAADLAPLFADWVGEPTGRTLLAWVTIFLGVVVTASLTASLLSEVVRKLGMSTLDRSVGALIGFARALLVLLAITLAVGLTKIPQSAVWKEAVLTPWMEFAALHTRSLLPDSVAAKVRYRAAAEPARSANCTINAVVLQG
ncbi:MAG: CvpA family protein [Burkholderiales bacterium]|nr:CvpA family protein [Rhodocyclaceae bacterium]